MTAEEFERQYAQRSGLTIEELRGLGRIVATCHCGEVTCQGWQFTTPERLAEELAMREIILLEPDPMEPGSKARFEHRSLTE
jgi:hypothetical protein